jgi:hypothetical protein
MAKKMILAALIMFLVLGFLSAPLTFPSPGAIEDKGRLIISFRDGQVGYSANALSF